VIERWVRFWDQREAPHSLALLRILFGTALLGDLLLAAAWGDVALVWSAPPVGAGYGQTFAPLPLAVRVFGASSGTGVALWGLAVFCCVLFVLGAAYRVTSIGLVFAMVELGAVQPVGDAIDTLLRLLLPVLAVSGANATWSVDAWWRRRSGRPVRELVPAWPRYLVFAQVVWVYISAGHQRNGAMWGPQGGFGAIGDVLGDPHFARFAPGSLSAFSPLMRLGTLETMVFELSAPLILLWTWLELRPERGGRLGAWARRYRIRWIWLGAGMSLHAGIALTMKIGLFPFGMLALYPAFVHPDELRRALNRAGALLARRRRLPDAPAG
jgi:hypothetical protein